MVYEHIVKGTFLRRPNRFIAHVMIDGRENIVHVKNTGRCKELLVPGCTVFLEKSDNPKRKTLYDLVSVIKECEEGRKILINMDSLAPNKVVSKWIWENREMFPVIKIMKPEYTFGNSRFDFYIEYEDRDYVLHKMFLEVKGCTLENNKIASFPDAPTERGLKHVLELTEIKKNSEYECAVLIVIQMKGCSVFKPNWETHEAFGIALQEAVKRGVKVFALDCIVTEDSLSIDESVPVDFTR